MGNTSLNSTRRGGPPVHPHARGEHSMVGSSLGSGTGSSPRPWGTPGHRQPGGSRARFIPTPVGNTPCSRPAPAPTPVHPHARGEHPTCGVPPLSRDGSSPRPWGTLAQADVVGLCSRFIPTPVGNTSAPPGQRCVKPVHPHARGEHADGSGGGADEDGSSPRPWGTQLDRLNGGAAVRFIPTPVGNTRCTP